MTEYLYRVVYKVKDEHWPIDQDPAKNKWVCVNNRSYSTLPIAKGIKTMAEKNYWHKKHKLKIQRYPLTQEWEDVDD
jgi:hypothetical protein